MDPLSLLGNIASLVGLFVSVYTLYKVENLPATLKRQSRDKQLSETIERIIGITPTKSIIADSTAREIEVLIKTVRLYYVSKIPGTQKHLKSLLTNIQEELNGPRQLRVLQQQLALLRVEITIR